MRRRDFLAAAAGTAFAAPAPPPQRPNVIWILGDQHRAQALGCAGDPNLATPNLDTMAAQGVRERVWRGGHFVPDDDVRRRYARSMENAAQLTLTDDIARLYDNSDDGHRLVLIAKSGHITFRADALPPWLAAWNL